MLMIIFSIIWFLKVPVYRYGYSYFVSFFSLGFAYLCTFNIHLKKKSYKFFISVLILFTILFTSKNLLRILKTDNLKVNSFCQILGENGNWINKNTNEENDIKLENAILNKAKKLKLSQS